MSVDAKLFVTCGKDKSVEVGNAVTKALNAYSRKKLDKYLEENEIISRFHFLHNKEYQKDSERFSNGVRICCHDFNLFSFIFGNGDDTKRVVNMVNHCNSDYKEVYEGDKIIFSIGCWGSSDEIMMVVAEAVKPFGDVYYDRNDCDDEDFVKLF